VSAESAPPILANASTASIIARGLAGAREVDAATGERGPVCGARAAVDDCTDVVCEAIGDGNGPVCSWKTDVDDGSGAGRSTDAEGDDDGTTRSRDVEGDGGGATRSRDAESDGGAVCKCGPDTAPGARAMRGCDADGDAGGEGGAGWDWEGGHSVSWYTLQLSFQSSRAIGQFFAARQRPFDTPLICLHARALPILT
jgi:hypothetical protein